MAPCHSICPPPGTDPRDYSVIVRVCQRADPPPGALPQEGRYRVDQKPSLPTYSARSHYSVVVLPVQHSVVPAGIQPPQNGKHLPQLLPVQLHTVPPANLASTRGTDRIHLT